MKIINLIRKNTEKTEAPESKFSGLAFLSPVLTASCIVLTVLMAVFVLWFYQGSYEEETAGGTFDRYYMLITQDSKSAFWQSVYQGANERALQDNVYVDWLGNDQFQNYSVEEQMQVAIASGVDGIIVTAGESEEMTALIDRAVDEGIPVVTLYGDNTQSARCSFVGVGSYNLGREYGRQVVKIVQERDAFTTDLGIILVHADEGVIATKQELGLGTIDRPTKVTLLVNAYAKGLDQNILYSGIQEAIEQERGDMVIELSLQSVDDTNDFSVEESIRDIFMEGDIPDVLICLNELNTTCAYQAVVDYNRVGTVSILGHYISDTILNAIDRNVIYATIDIDTAQMGSFCIDALQEYHELGYTSQYFTADISLVSKDNVDAYLKREEARNDE